MADKTLTLGTLFTGDATSLLTILKNIKAQINMIATAANQLKTSMGAMNNAVSTAKTTMAGYGLSTKATVSAMKGAVGESVKFKQALSQLNSVAAKTKTGFDTAHSTLMKVEKAIHATGQRMTAAGKNGEGFVNTANRMALVNQTLTGKLKTTSTGFQQVGTQIVKTSTATKKAAEQYVGFSKQISKVHGGLARLKAAFKVTAAYGLAATAIYTVINAFKVGVQSIIDYDQALKNLQAITGATDTEVSAMGDTIKEVARTTKFSTTEVAEGMVLLGQAGFDAGEAMNAMQATADLATGTLSDMKLVTDLLTTTIRAFNLDTQESTRVADVMANAINKSKLTIDKLRIAFNYVGATASQAGVTLEETAASMMTLANNGLRASTIGTGMRQVLSRLIAPSSRLREAYESHGIALDKVNPKTVGYERALKNLSAVLWNAEKGTVDMAKAFELFGLRGAQAAAILVKGYVGGAFQSALKSVYETGSAAGMAAIQAEGLGVKIKNLADRAKLVALGFGDAGVSGALSGFLDVLKSVTIAMEAFASSAIGGVIIKVGLLVGAFAAVKGAISLLVSVFSGLLITKMIASNFMLLTTGLGAATAGFQVMTGVLGKVRAALTVLWALIASHPVLAIAAGVATLLVSLNQWVGANEKLAKSLAVEAIEFNRMSAGVLLYAESLKSLQKGSDVYKATLDRFVQTYPEATKEILRMTNAVDLSTLSVEKLTTAMKFVAASNAWEAFRKAGQAAKEFEKSLGRETFMWFARWLIGAAETSSDYAAKVRGAADAQNQQIESLKRLVEAGGLTKQRALELIDTLGLQADKAKELKESFEAYFNKIAFSSEDAAKRIIDAFKDLPIEFEMLYNQLDAKRQADFVKAIDTMNREIAAHKKRGEDMGIAENELSSQIDAIRTAAYDKFVAGMDKEVEKAQKAADKRLKIEEDFIKKVEELEKKLGDNINTILEEGLNEKALIKKRELEAHAAIEKAKLAITIASQATATAAQKQAAIDAVQAASDAIMKLRDISKRASEEIKASSTATAGSVTATAGAISGSYESIATTITSSVIEPGEKIKKSQEDIRSSTKKTTDEIINDWKNAGENFGKEVKGFVEDGKQIIVEWVKVKDGVETSGTTIIEKTQTMKGKAGEYAAALQELIKELEKLKIEAEKPKEVKVATETAKTDIGEVVTKVGELDTKIQEKREITVDSSPFITAIQAAIDKVKDLIKKIAEIPKSITIKVNFVKSGSPGTSAETTSSGGSVGEDPGGGGGGTWVGPVLHSGGLAGGGPSMLERKEFVIQKSAVAKYGAGFFETLNAMIPSLGGGQLHTINLNINNTPHTLYGDEQAVSGLVKSLRRAQLVTA